MWNSYGTVIEMTEEDFGIALPINIHDVEFGASDSLRLTVETMDTYEIILAKEYDNITAGKVDFELTAAESALLPAGTYWWFLDWYRDGVFFCNLVLKSSFRVVSRQ